MGVREDLRWIRDNKERAGIFVIIAKQSPCKVSDLHSQLKTEDWWPIKSYVADLIDRGIVAESDSTLRITETGKKVFESLRTVFDIEGI